MSSDDILHQIAGQVNRTENRPSKKGLTIGDNKKKAPCRRTDLQGAPSITPKSSTIALANLYRGHGQ
jgi:hypothetical protein